MSRSVPGTIEGDGITQTPTQQNGPAIFEARPRLGKSPYVGGPPAARAAPVRSLSTAVSRRRAPRCPIAGALWRASFLMARARRSLSRIDATGRLYAGLFYPLCR